VAITMLITGPTLSPDARAEAEARGVRLVTIPAYTPSSEAAAVAAAEQVDAIIVRQCEINEQVITASTRLRVIVRHGVGYENIDLTAAARHNIPVYIARGANSQSVAELAFGLMFAVARAIPWLDGRVRTGHWDKPYPSGVELQGRTLGIVGLGDIARAVIAMVAPLRMPVLILDPKKAADAPMPPGATSVPDLAALLAGSDFVSLHCPLTPATRHMMNAASFAQMRPGSFLINTARGGLVDEQALAAALRDGPLAGAALDTFEQEPPLPDSPLWGLKNLVATPHSGASTRAGIDRVGLIVLRTALDVIEGREADPRARISLR
jgi:D-3-phosphoglycerate dehydrogenase